MHSLKLCCSHIEKYILNIVNCLIISGKYPSAWKITLITFVFINSDISNYYDLRSFSILLNFFIILEKLMELQLHSYLQAYLQKFNKVFVKILAVLDCTQYRWWHWWKVLVLLDYNKAFYRLSQTFLLEIWYSCKYTNKYLQLVKSCLTDTIQHVWLNNGMSQRKQ